MALCCNKESGNTALSKEEKQKSEDWIWLRKEIWLDIGQPRDQDQQPLLRAGSSQDFSSHERVGLAKVESGSGQTRILTRPTTKSKFVNFVHFFEGKYATFGTTVQSWTLELRDQLSSRSSEKHTWSV